MPSCKGIDDESSKQDTYNNPAELVAALRKHPARTLQDLHTQQPSIEKDAGEAWTEPGEEARQKSVQGKVIV